MGVVALVSLLTACTSDDGPATPVASAGPSASPTASPTAAPSASPTGPPASLPDRYVAAVGGDLVVDGVAAPAPRTLAGYDAPPDPTASPEEPGQYLVGVELSPDGAVAYADECCEPAAGRTVVVQVDGSAPDAPASLSAGSPAVSPDGRELAGLSSERLVTHLLGKGEQPAFTLLSFPPEAGLSRESLTQGPDGQLAFLETRVSDGAEPDGPSRVKVFARPPLPTFAPPDGTTYAAPVFRADGMLVVARQPLDPESPTPATGVVLDPADGRVVAEFALEGRVVDQDYDRTGTYLLTTYDDGRLAWQGAGRSGVLRSGGVTAAAW